MFLAVLKERAFAAGVRGGDSLDLVMVVSGVKARRITQRLFRAPVLAGGWGEIETTELEPEKEEHGRGQQSPAWRVKMATGIKRKAAPASGATRHSAS